MCNRAQKIFIFPRNLNGSYLREKLVCGMFTYGCYITLGHHRLSQSAFIIYYSLLQGSDKKLSAVSILPALELSEGLLE